MVQQYCLAYWFNGIHSHTRNIEREVQRLRRNLGNTSHIHKRRRVPRRFHAWMVLLVRSYRKLNMGACEFFLRQLHTTSRGHYSLLLRELQSMADVAFIKDPLASKHHLCFLFSYGASLDTLKVQAIIMSPRFK